eukprot:1030163-Pyramimonas_sp.AAC.2
MSSSGEGALAASGESGRHQMFRIVSRKSRRMSGRCIICLKTWRSSTVAPLWERSENPIETSSCWSLTSSDAFTAGTPVTLTASVAAKLRMVRKGNIICDVSRDMKEAKT